MLALSLMSSLKKGFSCVQSSQSISSPVFSSIRIAQLLTTLTSLRVFKISLPPSVLVIRLSRRLVLAVSSINLTDIQLCSMAANQLRLAIKSLTVVFEQHFTSVSLPACLTLSTVGRASSLVNQIISLSLSESVTIIQVDKCLISVLLTIASSSIELRWFNN